MNSGKFAIPFKNKVYLLVGLALMIIGFILMRGGGATDPSIFPEKEMFSFRRITLAPLFILAGFIVEVVAIMYIPKSK
ncbi:MAG: DUF3098 domain-containing protein [Bacteroidales bacterium]|nr:DUF3098 domain-containing protein [Bacteroidales bacterium]MDD4656854.1 DUF3098 domain-containing protein [Bacteroidales bacterium]